MIPVPISDPPTMRRLTASAVDVAQLANERIDLDLRVLVDDLHADLRELRPDDD